MVQIIAHRGARSIAPENTILAAQKAYENGAALWETDVSVTKDGYLILFHDETLKRTTDVQVKFPKRKPFLVKDFELDEILSLDVGFSFIENDPFGQIQNGNLTESNLQEIKGTQIPTLEQGLIFTDKMNWKINIELKDNPFGIPGFSLPKSVLDTINRVGIPYGAIVISSFRHEWLDEIKDIEPLIEAQALVGEDGEERLDFKDFSFPAYNVSKELIKASDIRQLKKMGKTVNVFTVNDPDKINELVSYGVDGIFTDFPQLFCPGKNSFISGS